MRCPDCGEEGTWREKKLPFSVASVFDWIRERFRAKRTAVCDRCGAEVVFPSARDHEAHFGGCASAAGPGRKR